MANAQIFASPPAMEQKVQSRQSGSAKVDFLDRLWAAIHVARAFEGRKTPAACDLEALGCSTGWPAA